MDGELGFGGYIFRQGYSKYGSVVDIGGMDISMVPGDDIFGDGQSDAEVSVFSFIEAFKKMRQVIFINALAIVDDLDDDRLFGRSGMDFDRGVCVTKSVAYQI